MTTRYWFAGPDADRRIVRGLRPEQLGLSRLTYCRCGGCYGCPDGWHSDDEPCGCTPDCLLGDDPCPDCGLHSVIDGRCAACNPREEPAMRSRWSLSAVLSVAISIGLFLAMAWLVFTLPGDQSDPDRQLPQAPPASAVPGTLSGHPVHPTTTHQETTTP